MLTIFLIRLFWVLQIREFQLWPGSVSTFAVLVIPDLQSYSFYASTVILYLCPTCTKPCLNLCQQPSLLAKAARTLWTTQLCTAALNIFFSTLPFKQVKTINTIVEKVVKVLQGHSYMAWS